MGQLLDALNAVDADIAAANEPTLTLGEPISDEPISSVVDEATESVIGAADSAARQKPAPDTAIELVTKLVRQAPLQALAVAFVLGIAVARRRR
jgi:hypothetical protein